METKLDDRQQSFVALYKKYKDLLETGSKESDKVNNLIFNQSTGMLLSTEALMPSNKNSDSERSKMKSEIMRHISGLLPSYRRSGKGHEDAGAFYKELLDDLERVYRM